ncbi:MAG: ferrochelatase [Deltaproteobacteria bacterium]|nr:ferrochelatase [Deltaproteobacteria bacterium]
MAAIDSILLIAFGGPERPEDIRPFLQHVTAGRNIQAERIEEVAHHYELMGGRSPLNELTRRQAIALETRLKSEGHGLPVYVGMRNWHPFLYETLTEMKYQGNAHALGIILSAFETEASWGRYMNDVRDACKKIGPGVPSVSFAPGWSSHPQFIDAVAARTDEALSQVASDVRMTTPLIFTAHSIPESMAKPSPYVSQFTEASRAVAQKIGHSNWSVAYQSRSGPPSMPWLEPDICDVLQSLAANGAKEVVVVPIGFVCDHVEVKYDLDVEAREVAKKLGLRFYRAAAVNDHPEFIEMLSGLVLDGTRSAGTDTN